MKKILTNFEDDTATVEFGLVISRLRNVFIKRGSTLDHDRFRQARREVKAMIKIKKKQYAARLKDSLLTNTRRFWSLVKSTTKQNW